MQKNPQNLPLKNNNDNDNDNSHFKILDIHEPELFLHDLLKYLIKLF